MVWKSIAGFEGYYEISDSGMVRSVKRKVPNKNTEIIVHEKILKPWIDSWGYPTVCLFKDGKAHCKKIHRLIAEAFIPPFVGEQVNHIDGNKSNNSIENLEWCTGSENMSHAYRIGLHGKAKPVLIVELGMKFCSIQEAARYVNGKHSGIVRCLTGRNKTHRGYHFELAEGDA